MHLVYIETINIMKEELTQKQKMFCLEYLKDFNATRAYKEVYWVSDKTANTAWPRMLVNVGIQEYLKSKTERITWDLWLSVEWVLQNLKEVSDRCMQKAPVLDKKGKQVQEYVINEDWEEVLADVWRFDSAWANSALEKIWKYFKMFTDKVEQSGDLNINVISYKKDSWQN
jgi:phage terminase small subunit